MVDQSADGRGPSGPSTKRQSLALLVPLVGFVGLSVAVPVGALFALDVFGLSVSHPSDDEMIAHFEEHRHEFAELLALLEANPALADLPEFSDEESPSAADAVQLGVGSAQLDRYLKLVRRLGIESVWHDEDGALVLPTSTVGVAVSGSAKGYVHSAQPPRPLVADTEGDADGDSGEVYRPLGPGWYVYYLWGV